MKTNLNVLRLFLASCVIFSHSPELIEGTRNHIPLVAYFGGLGLGGLAARGFFILSGALIGASWMNQPELIPFLRKRVLRIYPAFIACSLVCLLVVAPLVSVNYWHEFAPLSALKRALCLQEVVGISSTFAGSHNPDLNTPMWSIGFEFACYLMVAGMGALGILRGRLTACALLGLMLIMSALCFEWHPVVPWQAKLSKLPELASWFLLGSNLYLNRFFIAGLGRFIPAVNVDISYGLYLYGWPIQKLILWYWPDVSSIMLSLSALLLAGVVGWLSFVLVEKKGALIVRAAKAYWRAVSEPMTENERVNYSIW